MEPGKSLLVALMFVTILTLGLANVLSTLAAGIGSPDRRRHPLRVGWMVILAATHLDLFWRADVILGLDDVRFFGFLVVIGGPILLFFATQTLLDDDAAGDPSLVRPRFLVLLLGVQAWYLLVSATMAETPGASRLPDALLAATLAVMLTWPRPGVHLVGTATAAAIFVAGLSLVGMGVLT